MKDYGVEWFIARRYLASRRGARLLSLITLIAIGGITVGVMALVVVTAVMSGLQNDLRDKYLGSNPHVWLTTYGEGLRLDAWEGVLARVRTMDGVVAAAPIVETAVAPSLPNAYAEPGLLRGIDPHAEGPPINDITAQIRSGELQMGPTESGFPPLIIGEALADKFQAYPGVILDVISLQGFQVTQLGLQPRIRKFEVVDRFHTGMYEYDNTHMYTTVEAAQELANLETAVSGLHIRVADPDQATEIARNIEDELGGYPYRALDWMSLNSSLFSALQLEKMAMGIILLLIVVVAAFNIVSTLVMVVTDKTREIGILKSMGLQGRQVQRIFMMQGVVIGIVGSALGAAGGLFLTWLLDYYRFIRIPGDVYFIDYLPVAFDPVDVFVILAASLAISFVATLYPARQAARLFPVDAIRHE